MPMRQWRDMERTAQQNQQRQKISKDADTFGIFWSSFCLWICMNLHHRFCTHHDFFASPSHAEAEPSAALKGLLVDVCCHHPSWNFKKHQKSPERKTTFSYFLHIGWRSVCIHIHFPTLLNESVREISSPFLSKVNLLQLQRRTTPHLPADAVKAARLPGDFFSEDFRPVASWSLQNFRTRTKYDEET